MEHALEAEAQKYQNLLEVGAAAVLASRSGVQLVGQPGLNQALLTMGIYYLISKYWPEKMQKYQEPGSIGPQAPHSFYVPMPSFSDGGAYNDAVQPAGGFFGVTKDAGVRQQMHGGTPDPYNTDYLYRADLRGFSQLNPLDRIRWAE